MIFLIFTHFIVWSQKFIGISDNLTEGEHSILDLLNQCTVCPHITHEPLKDLLQYVIQYYSSVANIANQGSAMTRVKSTHSVDEAAQSQIDREKQRRVCSICWILRNTYPEPWFYFDEITNSHPPGPNGKKSLHDECHSQIGMIDLSHCSIT